MLKYTAPCIYLRAKISFSTWGNSHLTVNLRMWNYTAPCVNLYRQKYTFPHEVIHIKLWIPHSESTKKSFRLSSVEFYMYKKHV